MQTTAADYVIARQAMAVAEQILDRPDDPDALAVGRDFLHAQADAAARARAWRAELAAVPVDPVRQALLDRDLEERYGLDLSGHPHHGDTACRAPRNCFS